MSYSVDELLPLFRTRFPEFDAVADARIEMYLEDALCIFALCQNGVLYLAAHLMVLDDESGAGISGGSGAVVDGGDGEAVSESAGGVSASYKSQADTGQESFFTTTAYGRKYLTFRNSCSGYRFSVRVA